MWGLGIYIFGMRYGEHNEANTGQHVYHFGSSASHKRVIDPLTDQKTEVTMEEHDLFLCCGARERLAREYGVAGRQRNEKNLVDF